MLLQKSLFNVGNLVGSEAASEVAKPPTTPPIVASLGRRPRRHVGTL